MTHPAEIAVYSFLQDAMDGKTTMDEEVAEQVASDIKAALFKQFDSGPRDEFRLRMSNIGKPKCQLWFEKNDPNDKLPFPPHFLMNMILGDITEAVFKGLLRSAGVKFKDNDRVTLKLGNGAEIKGEFDMELDDCIDDVKSASPWSYQHKFIDFDTLSKNDSFGYVAQLVGYAKAANKNVGGWWVVNKGNGAFKYIDASEADVDAVLQEVEAKVDYINNDEPFERCFEPKEESYYRKKSGNLVLNDNCTFCQFKYKCWPNLQTLPSKLSKAMEPPMIDYVYLVEEEDGNDHA